MIAALLLLAAQAAAPASAPPLAAPVSATIAPELRQAAETVVRLAQVDAVLRATVDRQIAVLRSGAALSAQLDQNPAIRLQRSKNPQAWEAAIARIGAKQAEAFAALAAEMQPAINEQAVRSYAGHFSVAELRQLAAFYGTPLGRLLVERTPAISAETTAWLQAELPRRTAPLAAALSAEVQRELAPLMPPPANR